MPHQGRFFRGGNINDTQWCVDSRSPQAAPSNSYVRGGIAGHEQDFYCIGLSPQRHATYNLFYNDPEQTPAAAFRLDIAVAVPQPVSDSAAGIVSKLLPGGRCARLRHVGSDDGLGAAIQFLYGQWLVQSGESLRDFPLYCQRLRFFPDVAEHEAELDLYLPLAPLPTEQQASPGTASG